ncbi:unnamed protein product (macronuclear) [Paramecium tetraurelia]|uniref:Cation-transporting P-type ATPase N-terminal domain-containing protein n=1 Tax=Paramecium tetraurelia TaxID=5888 RepID=A0E6K0_PARTE|nr:uncharacterized protein GSPATT00003782001 [Paramecium tetraurelia]CAK90917.1 unnamed protein product [Paramecium tetraurelia]|eukprot:XP_001458314.1 hypothetical protein (macronuclear) [Paramecium tetraurelia strain d4-2]
MIIKVSDIFETSLTDGLTEEYATAKNKQYGDNKLTEKKETMVDQVDP